jgi:hypothetical protein
VLGRARPQTASVVKRASQAGGPSDRAHGDVPHESRDQLGRPARQTMRDLSRARGKASDAPGDRHPPWAGARAIAHFFLYRSDLELNPRTTRLDMVLALLGLSSIGAPKECTAQMDRDMDVDQSVWKILPLDDRSCWDQN